jgi:hypothetical protein
MWAELGGFFRVRFWCSERSAVPPPNQAGFQEHIFEKISVSKRRKRRKKRITSLVEILRIWVFFISFHSISWKKRESI